MQIALTMKLANAMGLKTSPIDSATNPLFSWTANWINIFERRKEDMVVMVNNATRFTVSIYGVKRNNFKDVASKMTAAIRNTLLAMNLNEELINEYMRQAGEIVYCSNNDRKITAWVNRQGLEAVFTVGRAISDSKGSIKYDDTLGHIVSRGPVNYSINHADGYIPAEKMIKALSELTGIQAYQYKAFELFVTLDLDIYAATRRLIVPADIAFADLHKLLQHVFKWKNYHLHDFTVFDDEQQKSVARLVMRGDDSIYDGDAILEDGCRLSDYFPKYKYMLYTYDMGDNWEHQIELARVIEQHNEDSPYLLEAVGQTPPEDVGGVSGFIDFRVIMLNPEHPDYTETKEWAGYWSPELREWDTRPKVIHCWLSDRYH